VPTEALIRRAGGKALGVHRMHPLESRAEDGRANLHDNRGQKNAENDVANIREKEGIRDGVDSVMPLFT